MKKVVLLFFILVHSININAQVAADFNIYKAGTNKLTYVFNDYITKYTDSTGGPNTPAEGSSQYYIGYDNSAGTWGGQLYFRIDGYTTPIDFTQYSHLVLSWKGVADINYETLSVGFEDATFKKTDFKIFGLSSDVTTYQQAIIDLSTYDYTTNGPVATNAITGMNFVMCCNGAIGYWFLDDIYLTNTPPTTLKSAHIEKSEISIVPNPSTGVYSINTNEKIDAIRVSDNLGNIVSIEEPSLLLNPKIDLSNYPDGLYILTISSNDKISTKKIIKSK